jgi:toxin HigB-1
VKDWSEAIVVVLSARFAERPPSNRLEKLRGDLEGFYSVRINDQWRVVFGWSDGDAAEVRIVDYH